MDKYANFVDHPRFGRRPIITGLNPGPFEWGVHLNWNTTSHKETAARLGKTSSFALGPDCSRGKRIPNTAIVADLGRQTPATIPVTHYFDLERQCLDCKRMFIFFAEEQKYWYEELGFGLDSDCVRCVECRKQQQGIARLREVYESLFNIPNRTEHQSFTMADACLTLIEHEVFTGRQTERIRMLLNSIAEDSDLRKETRFSELEQRLAVVEQK